VASRPNWLYPSRAQYLKAIAAVVSVDWWKDNSVNDLKETIS
jgi:hypothetical protein